MENLLQTTGTGGFREEVTTQAGQLWAFLGLNSNGTHFEDFGDSGHGVSGGNSSNESTGLIGLVDVPREKPFLPWDNSHNVISLATLMIEKVCICGLTPLLFLVGVPSNIISSLVFARQGLRDRMNLLLFSLALVDMAFVALFFFMGSHCLLGQSRDDLENWWKLITRKYFTWLHCGFLYSSGCLTTINAVERCVCVALPFKLATLIKTRTVTIIIIAIVVVIQAACALYPLELHVGSRLDPGETFYFLSLTMFYMNNKLLFDVVENTFLMIVIPFFTFIVVPAATAITVVKLHRAVTWRENSISDSSISRAQISLAKMLVMVSSVYIPTAAPNVALGVSPEGPRLPAHPALCQHFPGLAPAVPDVGPCQQFR